jgi:hypothetical protein
MRSLIQIATKAVSRTAKLVKSKKKAEKKEVSTKKLNKEEELASEEASKKEIDKDETNQEKAINEETIKKMLEAEKNEVLVNASGLEVTLRGHDYKVRLTKPAHDAEPQKLQTALTRNRALLEKSTEDLYNLHCGNIEKNKQHNQMVDSIEKGKIKPENAKMKAAFEKILKTGKIDLDTWDEKYLRPGIQNALVARANIDLLIPLINIRGGEAEYKGLEALPINDHINILRDNAAKQAAEDKIPPPEPEKTDEWTIQEFLTAAVIVIIIALLLKKFI